MPTFRDPTADEMREYLASTPFASEVDEFHTEEAIYWYANDYHSGQSSNLYSALSTSEYDPGPCCNNIDPDGMSVLLYAFLEDEFGKATRETEE